MKKVNTFLLLVLFAITSFGFVACEKDKNSEPEMKGNTITDIAAANPNFSSLVAALKKAGLASALADKSADFTVFAPTNAAFASLLTELKVASLNDIPTDVLTKVLLYHVKSGEAKASQIATGYYSSISPGQVSGSFLSFYVDMATTTINGRAKITQTDIMADNGVIHVIDKVMLPMSITDNAVANPMFSSLVAAVTKANLAAALDDDTKSYTLFAPTNAAFSNLFTTLGVTLNDLSAATLTPILLHHVVNAYVPASAVVSGYVPTLSTAFGKNVSLQIAVKDGKVKLNDMAQVTYTDVVATNGIIHVIDKVLLPPTVVDIASQNSMFSTLVAAVVKADLAGTLSGAGPFTVFAPTNDAFAALFTTLGVSGVAALSKEALTPILLAHVVSGNVQSSALVSGMVPTLNSSKSLSVVVNSSGVTINGSINVIKADVQGKNGVVHVINKVIVP